MKDSVSGTPSGGNNYRHQMAQYQLRTQLTKLYYKNHPTDLRDRYSTTAQIRDFERSTGVSWESFVNASQQAKYIAKMQKMQADQAAIQGTFSGLDTIIGGIKNIFNLG